MAAPAEPTTHWSKKPLTLRIISAAVLSPIVVAAVYAGHPAWDLLVVLFGGVMAWEWGRIVARGIATRQNQSFSYAGGPAALIGLTTGALLMLTFRESLPPNSITEHVVWIFLAAATIFVMLPAFPRYKSSALWFGLGLWYVLVPCAAIIVLRGDPAVGLQQILWIVALVIAADTGAYIAGRSIGGPKLAPRISPNKTWAGLFGAMASAAIVGAITASLMDLPSVAILTVISAGLAVIEQAGDLAESAFKRHFGVKDASNIIPGHGGALDRVDGLIAVAAAVAGINFLIGSSVLTWL
jgi:phosphatidate cytidylyltransferase